jgi:site-specific DNA recombinase
LWFGYIRVYANPDEPVARKRVILREELHPVNAPAVRDAAERILRGESAGSIIREWTERGIKPVKAQEWTRASFTSMLTSPRIAGLLAWQGQKFPTSDWPAIIDVDTHEQLVKLFSDPARRKHVVGAQRHLLSGLAPCPKCGHGLKYRKFSTYRDRADSYACVRGVGGRCGGVAVKAELLEEYVTGAVLDALESPRVQEALRADDQDAARREELLAKIQRAQDIRADARRDLADGVIDRNDWLDIRQRTEDTISTARREYDRLAGSATVLGDIPPADSVREAWESWNTDRRRAAIKAVLHKIIVKNLPPGTPNNPGGKMKDPVARREREMAVLRQRVEFDWRV